MKYLRKVLGLGIAILAVSAVAACKGNEDGDPTYTFRTTTAIEPKTSNPHTWETNEDGLIHTYTMMGFVDAIYDQDKNDGSYKFEYEMAESIENYTPNATSGEKAQWGIEPGDKNRMYKIKLNKEAKWEDGTPINADSYVYSMKQLLDPAMRNYRANSYISGESSIVGANEYYWNGRVENVSLDNYAKADANELSSYDNKNIMLDLTAFTMAAFDLKPSQVKGSGYDSYLMVGEKYLWDLWPELFNEKAALKLTEESLTKLMNDMMKTSAFAVMEMSFPSVQEVLNVVNKTEQLTDADLEALIDAFYILSIPYTHPTVEYDDTVGLYKVDDYTIMYVLNTEYSPFYFNMSMVSTWLVHEDLYETGKTTVGDLVSTNYGSSKDTYASYGPYRLDSYEKGKQLRFVRNENWYGYTDNKHEGQYKTDTIIIDVVQQHETVMMGFNNGKYDEVALTSTDMETYGNSDYLKAVNTTYTWRLSFNTNLETLKKLEGTSGTNKQVLANDNFRKAFSLAINRQEFINEAVGMGTPAHYLINDLYMYDVENNPNSVYRNTEPAKKAVVDLQGLKYGENEQYKTLDDAYDAVSGYDLSQARALMQKAYEECIANGTYKDGQKISLDLIVTSKDSISEAARKNATVLDRYLKAAIVGTGFEKGGIVLNPKNLNDYYNQMLQGACEMIFAAWGGAVYWPYSTIECYVNDAAGSTTIHEGACWNPETTDLELSLDFDQDGTIEADEKRTETYNYWGQLLNSIPTSKGGYADASFELKNEIMAALEYNVLNLYYTIPLYCDASVSLDSKRLDYISDDYNIMYGFGGIRFLDYKYSDQEWEKYVAEQGGTLNYQ